MARQHAVCCNVLSGIVAATLIVVPASSAKPGVRGKGARAAKVEICHVPAGKREEFRTIRVGRARRAHLRHGDHPGKCTAETCRSLSLCDDSDPCTEDICSAQGCEHRATPCPPPGGGIWAPTTTPYDPACKDCDVLLTIELPHLGTVEFAWNPNVDDPVAQWSDCTAGLVECITDDRDPVECSAQSSCPPECRMALEIRLQGLTDRHDIVAAFHAVYSDDGALCRPRLDGVTP